MKAKIVSSENLADNTFFFEVYADDKVVKCISYKDNVPETDMYNKEKNYARALELAKKIEENQSLVVKETIYESEVKN